MRQATLPSQTAACVAGSNPSCRTVMALSGPATVKVPKAVAIRVPTNLELETGSVIDRMSPRCDSVG